MISSSNLQTPIFRIIICGLSRYSGTLPPPTIPMPKIMCENNTSHIIHNWHFPDLSYYIIAVIRTAYSLCLPVSLSGKLRPLFLTTFSRLSPHMLDAVFPLAPHGFFRFRELQEIVCLSPFPMKMFRSSDNDTRRSRRPLFRQ